MTGNNDLRRSPKTRGKYCARIIIMYTYITAAAVTETRTVVIITGRDQEAAGNRQWSSVVSIRYCNMCLFTLRSLSDQRGKTVSIYIGIYILL